MFIKQALSFDRSCTRVVNEFIIDNIVELPKKLVNQRALFDVVGKNHLSNLLKN
ncbi:MAG: hypothetical protein ACJAYB_002657 [Psychromonas sp.]|jgi:hypothetical protein